ncbi:endonuclease YncB(thermonuclease family) [Lentzea atacamensis]|uniref:Endonuclease YncB(Thermonuclease family) n=1 Tax=Lentzea atacamensis TaxID=531938 RepID=A0ABX9EBA0_9PSEU|nr:cellulose binding domain-containing protein [Lentzea atacamensis]RAS67173.1 endonuclease YncB(thermonuclease family) [Lentzea atacamensis]
MNGRRWKAVVLTAALLTAACVSEPAPPVRSTEPAAEPPVALPTLTDTLTVRGVADGRTVLLSDTTRIQIEGLAAPEECWATAATTFAKGLLLDKPVRIERVPGGVSPLRLQDGTEYALLAVRQGILRTDSPNDAAFADAEAAAAKAGLGLWGPPCRGQATTPAPPPATTPPPGTPAPRHGCDVSYRVTHQATNGFRAEVVITNTGNVAVTGWTLRWRFTSGQVVAQVRHAKISQSGSDVSAINLPEFAAIPTGATRSFVFTAMQMSDNPAPKSFTLNGHSCTVS